MIRRLYGSLVRQPHFRKVVMSTPVIRDLAWRFVAGENLDSGIAAVQSLNGRGIQGTLNYVGTHVRDHSEATAAADSAIAALERIHKERAASHLSLKLTQIGLDIDEDLCRAQLRRVLDSARATGNFVRIDMEESEYVERTLHLFEEARAEYGSDTVGIVIQSYLRDDGRDLNRVVAGGSRVRLVKGGYWESPTVVYRKPEEIDRCFARDIELLLARGQHAAIATHDARFITRTKKIAERLGLDRRTFEFQMLYGVRTDLQEQLVQEGYNVRCYVPYGGEWYNYFLGCARRIPGGALRRFRERLHASNDNPFRSDATPLR
jgi:proline dehydrogenase